MAIKQSIEEQQATETKSQVFAARFLEKGPELVVPDGHYDPQQQVYVDLEGKPVFVDEFLCTSHGNEITTHHSTTVSGLTVSDPDNG